MNSTRRPIVVAHRGNRSIAPENTLAAASAGFEAGATWWELDVAESADGVLVVVHDDTLVRTTDARIRFPGRSPWSVYDFTLRELASLDAGGWYRDADPFGMIAAGVVGEQALASFDGLRIPTLEECLHLTRSRGGRVNIEIKDATGRRCDGHIVERTVELVRAHGMGSFVLVSSFNHEYLHRVKRAAGGAGIATAALTEDSPGDIVERLADLGAIAWHPDARRLDETTARAVLEAGFDVNVWTVNGEEAMRRLLSWGVTGLITDFVGRALAVIDSIRKPSR